MQVCITDGSCLHLPPEFHASPTTTTSAFLRRFTQPTHQLEWLASPQRFRLGSLQAPSALPIMDDFPDFG